MADPLTPPECDLRDFPFMPLQVARLMASKAWMKARRNPGLAFYMLNLWMESWHEKPAASLEDDDEVLADKARCSPDLWPAARESAMYGWVLCSDGRWYHPTVAEQALVAWQSKLAQRHRTEAARAAALLSKEAKRRQAEEQAQSLIQKAGSVTESVGQVDRLQGTGTGTGIEIEKKGIGKRSSVDAAAAASTQRGTRLPEPWKPSTSGLAYIRKQRPDLDPAAVAEDFRDYWGSIPGKDGTKLDWEATWRRWVRNQKAGSVAGVKEWWETKQGIIDKALELVIPGPVDGAVGEDWLRFVASVWVAAGDGPWWNERETAYRYAVRLRNGGE